MQRPSLEEDDDHHPSVLGHVRRDRLRGQGSWEKAVRTIENYEKKDELYLLVCLSTINKGEITGLLDFFRDRVAGFWFSFAYETPGMPGLELTAREKSNIGKELLIKKENYNIFNTDEFLSTTGRGKECRHWVLATVLADGTFAGDCYPRRFEGIGCANCDLACYRDLNASLFPEDYI